MILDLTNEDLLILNNSLGNTPYKIAAPLIDKINRQIFDQSEKKETENKKDT